MNETIPISEKLYLLAIHPDKGGIVASSQTAIDYILVGSIILELYQKKNISIEKKKIIILNTRTDNKLHGFILDKLSKYVKPLKISTWISKLYYSMKHIRKEVQHRLENKRLIKLQKKRFLFFSWKKPSILNKPFVHKLVDEIELLVFGRNITEDEIILLSLLKPAGLVKRIFPEKEKRKLAKQKLKNLMVENQVSSAVANAISASQAVAASVAISVAASSATTS